MPSFDITRLADILREASRAETLPRFRRLEPGMVRQKAEAIDLVTEADEAAERRIKAEVAAAWPEALFVGEESVAADPSVLDRFDTSDFAIVVDPVDGTANFAAGLPLYATMASVVHRLSSHAVRNHCHNRNGSRRPRQKSHRTATARAPVNHLDPGPVK